jgi:hypothetical protein
MPQHATQYQGTVNADLAGQDQSVQLNKARKDQTVVTLQLEREEDNM